jgi:hypothetical protein
LKYLNVFLASELKSYGYLLADITDDELAYIDSIYKGGYPGEQGLLPYGNPTRNDAEMTISIAHRIGLATGQGLNKDI